MRIESAAYRAGELILKTTSPDAMRFVYGFKAGDYEIKPEKKKRSLSANAYAWELIGLLAEKLRLPQNEIYRREIIELGGNTMSVTMAPEAVAMAVQLWESNGIGWQAKVLDESPDKVTLMLFYGSSKFDVSEMSRFIDNLISECQQLDIETKPKAYVDSLLRDYK